MAMKNIMPYPKFEKFMVKNKMNKAGHSISVSAVDKFLKNILPKNATCQDCRDQDLARLSYVGKFRDDGLLQGRYTGKDGTVIRTYPITYNNSWVLNYATKAFNAVIRGNKLNNSTPIAHMKHKTTNDKHFKAAQKALSLVK